MVARLMKRHRYGSLLAVPGSDIRAVAQLVARFVRDEEVVGSSPASPTKGKIHLNNFLLRHGSPIFLHRTSSVRLRKILPVPCIKLFKCIFLLLIITDSKENVLSFVSFEAAASKVEDVLNRHVETTEPTTKEMAKLGYVFSHGRVA